MITVAGSLGHHRNSQHLSVSPRWHRWGFFRATLGDTAVPGEGVDLAVRGYVTAEPSKSLRVHSVGTAVR